MRLLVLVLGLVAPALAVQASGAACYDGGCPWSRSAEEAAVERAESGAGALIEPGPAFTPPAHVLMAHGRLRVEHNVTAHEREWQVLVTLDLTDCPTLLRVEGLSVPGYDGLTATLAELSSVSAEGTRLDLTLCGTVHAGFTEAEQVISGGQLRVQDGGNATLILPLGDAESAFTFWRGYTATLTLGLSRADRILVVDLDVGLHLLYQGDLGWGTGTVRADLASPGWTRTLVLHPEACVAASAPAAGPMGRVQARACIADGGAESIHAGASRPSSDLPGFADEATNGWADPNRHDPVTRCATLTGAPGEDPPYVCYLGGMTLAFPAIAKDRLDEGWRTLVRVNPHADQAAEFVEACDDLVPTLCATGTAGAVLTISGLPRPVDALSRVQALDRDMGRLLRHFGADSLCDDLIAWASQGGTHECGDE